MSDEFPIQTLVYIHRGWEGRLDFVGMVVGRPANGRVSIRVREVEAGRVTPGWTYSVPIEFIERFQPPNNLLLEAARREFADD